MYSCAVGRVFICTNRPRSSRHGRLRGKNRSTGRGTPLVRARVNSSSLHRLSGGPMKVLVVGAAGYVGSIIIPALEKRHDCRYLDLRPVPRRKSKSFVGDINDDTLVRRAVKGVEAVIFMAMGLGKPT